MSLIRPARPADADAIAKIYNQVIRETTITFTNQEKTIGEIADQINGAPCFLVFETDQIAGFASFGAFRSGPGYAHTAEHSIYLATDMRGKGIARNLLEAIEHKARIAGIEILIGGISSENNRGLAFHLKCGFEQVAKLPGVGRKFGRDLDLIFVQKTL